MLAMKLLKFKTITVIVSTSKRYEKEYKRVRIIMFENYAA